ncbi:(Fe-S)-binding protein [Kitasatospora purpeofusca]|uniref:(Fe-S)-binding protein n=1 Tax=Kitasatospora purpeofusca TaxID=67352 RepID=UPI0035DB3EB8
MRVALFATCVNDALMPSTAIATVRLLERLGVEVDFPAAQSCCGQPQYNSGYRRACEPLVRRTVRAFAGYRHVVAPSGSCVATVRTAHPRIAARAGGGLAAAVGELTPRVYELSEFLVDVLGVEDVGAWFPHPVTYHPSCHGLRLLGLGDRPLRLLRAVRGLELLELPGAEECCGFGGTFALKNAAVSAAMAGDKTTAALATGAEVLCGGDTSCLLHLGGTLRRQGAPLRPLHLAEILASTEAEPWRAP